MIKKSCVVCKVVFEIQTYRKQTAKFCSRKCKHQFGVSSEVRKKISDRNKIVMAIPEMRRLISERRKGKGTGFKGKHHTEEAKLRLSIWRIGRYTGSKHPMWRGGLAEVNHIIRNSPEYKLWRTSVFERDNYTCQLCGQWGGRLNADHIKGFASHAELRFEIDNGRTLCVECHRKTPNWGRPIKKQLIIA